MKIHSGNVFSAIRSGDLKIVNEILETESSEGNISRLLTTRGKDRLTLRRPSTGLPLVIYDPPPIFAAVASLEADIVEAIAKFEINLDMTCVVDDTGNNVRSYDKVTALHIAASTGKISMVKSLIKHGAGVNKQTSNGDSALHEASAEGHLPIVEYLTNNGADTNISTKNMTTPLMVSSYADHAAVIQYLTECGVDTEVEDLNGRNVLFYTVAGGRCDTLDFFLNKGVPIKPDKNGVTILMEAAQNGQLDIVKYLLKCANPKDVDVCAVDDHGRNVLFYAIEPEKIEVFEYLLSNGTPFRQADDGRTVLMTATLTGNINLVRYIVNNAGKLGLPLNEKDDKGRNCLFYCITGSDERTLDFLIESGVKIESSVDDITVLMQAVAKQRLDFCKHLLLNQDKYSIDVDAADKDGWTAMMYAVASGHIGIFDLLVSYGAASIPARDGRTILMQAAARGDMSFLRHILLRPSDYEIVINQRDMDGWNAIFYTIQGNHVEAFKFLVKRGAKMCAAINGSTPLMEAADKGRVDLVEYMVKMAASLNVDINHRDQDGANVLFYCVAGGHLGLFKCLLNTGVRVEHDNSGRNLLMQAALSGHLQIAQYIINNLAVLGIDKYHQDSEGRNAVFYSVESGNSEILDFLLAQGIPCERDNSGRTLLMQAARVGNHRLICHLLTNLKYVGMDVNARDINGENALFYAMHSNHVGIVKTLLESGVSVANNDHDINVLAQCMLERKKEIVNAILESNLTDIYQAVNGKDVEGRSLYHHCIISGDYELLVKMSMYYNPHLDKDIHGVSALMLACQMSDAVAVRYLVETMKVDLQQTDLMNRGAISYALLSGNVNHAGYLLQRLNKLEIDRQGETALMHAASMDQVDFVKKLLKTRIGRDILHCVDKKGRNAAHYAAIKGSIGTLTLLKDFDCDIDVQDMDGATPLMHACSLGYYNVVAILLRNGATIDTLDSQRQTALHYCFRRDSPSLKCVRVLVNFGADLNDTDESGLTPLMIACQRFSDTQIAIISYLLRKGADPCQQDNNGMDAFDHTPFDAAYVKELLKTEGEIGKLEKEALTSYKTILMNELELNSLLRGLLQERVFTKTLNFEVMKRPQAERVPRLLELLSYRGRNAFRGFCNVLKSSGEHELAYTLMKAAYQKHDELLV